MIKLRQRSHAKETIDDPTSDPKLLRQTYRQINAINACTLGSRMTLEAVRYFLKRYGHRQTISILDIGCGDGQMLRQIAHAAKGRFSLQLTGMEINPEVITMANAATTMDHLDFIQGNVLTDDHPVVYDLIISSLTAHHLADEDIVKLIAWMTRHARIGWYICDLHRHVLAYYFIKYSVRIFGCNRLICHDAPLSVARGFRRAEWAGFLAQGQVDQSRATISWYPNFRYGIRYEKWL
jgi:2-polyprenyl-3-methyl-5-hydroxy-6-metoxy-1,4-benzoquinol methylase